MSLNFGLLSCESNPPQSDAELPLKIVSKSATSTTASSSTTSTKVILRLHGSNTIGANLVPALAKAFLEQEGATVVKPVPVAHDEINIEGQFDDGTARVIEIQAHGSSTGFKDLADNQCDIGMASRKIKDAEVQTLSALGDMTAPDSEHVLAVDGIAVIVHPSNPVVALEKEKLAKIFAGQIQTWEPVGSNNTDPINVYARDDKSGTYDTFKSLVLEPVVVVYPDKVLINETKATPRLNYIREVHCY